MCSKLAHILVFYLTICLLVSYTVKAIDLEEYAAEIKEIQAESAEASNEYIKEAMKIQQESASKVVEYTKKVAEVLDIKLPDNSKNVIAIDTDDKEDLEKYVFISLSMSEKGLFSIIKQAKELGFIPVLRGFKDRSYIKTQDALAKIIKETDYGVIIQPELFKEFDIKVVPSFVVTKEDNRVCPTNMSCIPRQYNKLSGNVTIDYALKTLINKGETL